MRGAVIWVHEKGLVGRGVRRGVRTPSFSAELTLRDQLRELFSEATDHSRARLNAEAKELRSAFVERHSVRSIVTRSSGKWGYTQMYCWRGDVKSGDVWGDVRAEMMRECEEIDSLYDRVNYCCCL